MPTFPFEELTWPDIAALPRDTDLVLPLGPVQNPDALPELLKTSQPVGVLPFIPFGWPGSGIEVPPPVFNAMVYNLIGNLLEDGFANIHLLTPVTLDLGSEIHQIMAAANSPIPLPEDTRKVLLQPIGHTEQHGYHSPLSTDSIIIEAIGQGVAKAVPKQAACLPAFPYGVSTHRRSFPGTFNVGGREFEDFWLAVIDTLVGSGFGKLYLLSGHGGNCSFLTNVIKYAGEKHPHIFCATSFLYLSGPKGVAALDSRRDSAIGGMGHACELETSLVLHLRPELIHLDRAVDETSFIATPSYYMDWIEGGALIANPPWEDDTRTGAYGAGSLANAKKGQYWLKEAIEEKVDHVLEIQEQYRRRKERREKK
jgi:creatinine amidohydrolase